MLLRRHKKPLAETVKEEVKEEKPKKPKKPKKGEGE